MLKSAPSSMHTIDPSAGHRVAVKRQPHAFLNPAYKLSYTNICGERECIIVIARTTFAVESMARRVLGIHGCYDFVVGRYRGAREPEPAPSRSQRTRNG